MTMRDSPAVAMRRPTLAVYIASFFVLLHCVLNVVVGVLELLQGAMERLFPAPPNALTPVLDPFYAGVINLLIGGFTGWCQYGAVHNRSRVRSYLAGVLFLVWGVLVCITPWGTMWDAAHYVLVGTALFVGISMVRWGRQLAGQ